LYTQQALVFVINSKRQVVLSRPARQDEESPGNTERHTS